MLNERRTIPSAVTWEHQLVSLLQRKAAIFELPLHLTEHHTLLNCRQTLHFYRAAVATNVLVYQFPIGDASQREAAEFFFITSQRAQHGLCVGVNPLGCK